MRKFAVFVFVAFVMAFTCCSRKPDADPKEAPSKAMLDALKKLDARDYDAYLACADIVGEDDSAHMELYRQLLNQHREYQESKNGDVSRYEVVDVKFACDSVCTVLYQIVFSDSTKETCSQKMVLVGNIWKIKIRN